MPQYKLVFRGDDRTPQGADGIFKIGLKSRDYDLPNRLATPKQFGDEVSGYADFDKPSSCCLTSNFRAAPIFPQMAPALIWVYCVGIDVTDPETVNGHARMVSSHVKSQRNNDPKSVPIYWYTHEYAVKAVPVKQIALALCVERQFGAYKEASSFRVMSYLQNTDCPLNQWAMNILVTFAQERQVAGWTDVATMNDGFTTGTGEKITLEDCFARMM